MEHPSPSSSVLPAWVAPVAAGVVAVAVTLALLGVVPWELRHQRLVGAFHDGHVWAFDHLARMLVGLEPLSGQTSRIGYPGPVLGRFIGWVPALLAAPRR